MGAAAGAWRFVVQRRVWSLVIVLFAPFVQLFACLAHALELDSTQYLVAHRPIEALYLPVLRRLPRTRKLERYPTLFAPPPAGIISKGRGIPNIFLISANA